MRPDHAAVPRARGGVVVAGAGGVDDGHTAAVVPEVQTNLAFLLQDFPKC